jgi:hypothetical protein
MLHGRNVDPSTFFFFDFPTLERAHADRGCAAGAERRLLKASLVTTCPHEKAAPSYVITLVFGGRVEVLGANVASNRFAVLEENRVARRDETFGEIAHVRQPGE